jgi:hypothetical protein
MFMSDIDLTKIENDIKDGKIIVRRRVLRTMR